MTQILLPDGLVALVDDEDTELVGKYKWVSRRERCGRTFYVQRNVILEDGRRTTQQLHQLIMGAVGVDHINRNGLDNRRSNLRLATPSQNAANSGPRSGSYKGVTQRQARWRAQIRIDGHNMQIGTYDTPEDAARAYDARAFAAWGEFAYLNFPDEIYKRTA